MKRLILVLVLTCLLVLLAAPRGGGTWATEFRLQENTANVLRLRDGSWFEVTRRRQWSVVWALGPP